MRSEGIRGSYVAATSGIPLPTAAAKSSPNGGLVTCPRCPLRTRPGAFHICLKPSDNEAVVEAPKTDTEPVVESPEAPTPKQAAVAKHGGQSRPANRLKKQVAPKASRKKVGRVSSRVEEIIRRYEAGETTASLAVDVGVGQEAIRRGLRARGVTLRPNGDEQRGKPRKERRALTDEQTAELIDRYLTGETLVSLGKAFSINPNTVSQTLRREGVQTRPTGPMRREAGPS